jgi:two-component system, sporulation sensor kinase D
MITLIPALLISHFIAQNKTHEHDNHYITEAQKIAVNHANEIDSFIGETISRLDMLATITNINANSTNNIKEVLTRTQEKDIRFSGYYWANPEGDLLIGSNDLSSPINVSDRQYFQEAIRTGKYKISPAHIGRVTGRFIITIATPVFENEEVNSVLLGSLRIDKIEEAIKSNITDEVISVSDDIGQVLVRTHSSPVEANVYSYTQNMRTLPWTITAQVIPKENHVYERAFLTNIALFLIINNILFLLLQYFLLKRRIKHELEQNEKQKLELVENLAASTAHEIRNPLTGIKGLIQLLSEKYKDEKDQLYFKIIQEEVNRINSIVSELLLLGKPTAHTLKTCDANGIIKEIEPIIMSEANYSSVQVSIRYSTSELPISCVKDHLKQVILNLIKNSLEAVNNGGELILSLDKQDTNCIIKVVDNGSGIPEDVLTQIFNPFFTSKENGTGLGLVVCKRIIQSYGGKIQIKSKSNEGTEVELCIPLENNSTNEM